MRIRAVAAAVCMLAVTVMLAPTAVQATQAKKQTTYNVAVAICEWGNGPNYQYFVDAEGNSHELDTWHFGPQYVLFEGKWVDAGTFRADVAETAWGYTMEGNPFWHNEGTFTMLGTPLGDVHGRFYWDPYDMSNSVATGTAVNRGRRIPVQMMLLLEVPAAWPSPPSYPCSGTGEEYPYRFVSVTVPNSAAPGPA